MLEIFQLLWRKFHTTCITNVNKKPELLLRAKHYGLLW